MVEGLHEFPTLPQVSKRGHAIAVNDDESVGNNTLLAYSVNFPLSIWALYNIPNNTAVTNTGATQGCFAQFAAGIEKQRDRDIFVEMSVF